MNDKQLQRLLDSVREGRLPRRTFVHRMLGLGLSLPMAGTLLLNAGVAQSQPVFEYKPKRRGGGGTVRIIRPEASTVLNPHLASGTKDQFASRIFYEPLAFWDAEANLQPVLAAAIPSKVNGGLAADGRSVVWTLKKGVTWHDGVPFTADDLLFNAQYASDPAAAAFSAGNYAGLRLEKIDSHTVRVVFDKPTPFWPGAYCTQLLIPRHRFAPFLGARVREAPENLAPVGTGPYRHGEFRPGDFLRAEIHAGYHVANRPHFDRVELKGGGDGLSAARTVLQTGEYDLASGVLADDELLRRMEAGGKGRVLFTFGSSTTALFLNAADPAQEVDGERSHHKTQHPLWSDPALRRAFGLLIDRTGFQRSIYGRQAMATGNWVNNPPRYRSPAVTPEFDLDKARQLLDAAGWKPGPDGVRVKNGKRLSVLFQGSNLASVEKYMAVIKSAADKAGFAMELKVIVPSVYFSGDVANPDTFGKFNADIQTYAWSNLSPDPEGMVRTFVSWEVAGKANKWQGRNAVRWQSSEYDALYKSTETELDPVKRAALFVRMNELIAAAGYVIPILANSGVRVVAHSLRLPISPWSYDTGSLADWYREA